MASAPPDTNPDSAPRGPVENPDQLTPADAPEGDAPRTIPADEPAPLD